MPASTPKLGADGQVQGLGGLALSVQDFWLVGQHTAFARLRHHILHRLDVAGVQAAGSKDALAQRRELSQREIVDGGGAQANLAPRGPARRLRTAAPAHGRGTLA